MRKGGKANAVLKQDHGGAHRLESLHVQGCPLCVPPPLGHQLGETEAQNATAASTPVQGWVFTSRKSWVLRTWFPGGRVAQPRPSSTCHQSPLDLRTNDTHPVNDRFLGSEGSRFMKHTQT